MAYSETRFVPAPWWRGYQVKQALVGASLAVLLVGGAFALTAPTTPMAASSVKVQLKDGHGSGVHIGDGLVLSAGHVIGDAKSVQLKMSDGTTRDADVLWVNPEVDVALLQTNPGGLEASPINCAPMVVGDAVTVTGNPDIFEFVTTRGHIAGATVEFQGWGSVTAVDITLLPGMSGGGAINSRGEVVGIAVAFLSIPIDFSASATGLGFIVPASVVCELLGRT